MTMTDTPTRREYHNHAPIVSDNRLLIRTEHVGQCLRVQLERRYDSPREQGYELVAELVIEPGCRLIASTDGLRLEKIGATNAH